MSYLPKCKLCGHDPAYLQTGDAVWCDNVECILCVGRAMTQAKWRALMSPTPDDSHLLRTLADIREALGVGAKPMLDELPGMVLAVKAERDEMARSVIDRCLESPSDEPDLDVGTCKLCGMPAAECREGCPVRLAEAIIYDTATLAEKLARDAGTCAHAPGCPVALAEKTVKEEKQ